MTQYNFCVLLFVSTALFAIVFLFENIEHLREAIFASPITTRKKLTHQSSAASRLPRSELSKAEISFFFAYATVGTPRT